MLANGYISLFAWTNPINPEPTRVKHLSAAQLKGRPLALPLNIRLGWKSLPGTNTFAYCKLQV